MRKKDLIREICGEKPIKTNQLSLEDILSEILIKDNKIDYSNEGIIDSIKGGINKIKDKIKKYKQEKKEESVANAWKTQKVLEAFEELLKNLDSNGKPVNNTVVLNKDYCHLLSIDGHIDKVHSGIKDLIDLLESKKLLNSYELYFNSKYTPINKLVKKHLKILIEYEEFDYTDETINEVKTIYNEIVKTKLLDADVFISECKSKLYPPVYDDINKHVGSSSAKAMFFSKNKYLGDRQTINTIFANKDNLLDGSGAFAFYDYNEYIHNRNVKSITELKALTYTEIKSLIELCISGLKVHIYDVLIDHNTDSINGFEAYLDIIPIIYDNKESHYLLGIYHQFQIAEWTSNWESHSEIHSHLFKVIKATYIYLNACIRNLK